MDFSEGADSLNASVKELVFYIDSAGAKGGGAGIDAEKFRGFTEQVHGNLEKSVALERKLWKALVEKGAKGEQARTDRTDLWFLRAGLPRVTGALALNRPGPGAGFPGPGR